MREDDGNAQQHNIASRGCDCRSEFDRSSCAGTGFMECTEVRVAATNELKEVRLRTVCVEADFLPSGASDNSMFFSGIALGVFAPQSTDRPCISQTSCGDCLNAIVGCRVCRGGQCALNEQACSLRGGSGAAQICGDEPPTSGVASPPQRTMPRDSSTRTMRNVVDRSVTQVPTIRSSTGRRSADESIVTTDEENAPSSSVVPIVAGAVGGVCCVIVAALLILYFIRQNKAPGRGSVNIPNNASSYSMPGLPGQLYGTTDSANAGAYATTDYSVAPSPATLYQGAETDASQTQTPCPHCGKMYSTIDLPTHIERRH